MKIREMQHSDCTRLISNSRLARLACCKDNVPYVLPISFRYFDGHILSFSRPGKKIEWMRKNPRVCVEIEHISDKHEWKCVLVDGVFREITQRDEREYAWSILQEVNDWWEPGGLKPNFRHAEGDLDPVYFKITFESMSGREAYKE